jgi:outer membrane protein assembly factor BamA
MSIFEVNGRYSEEGQLSVFLPDSIYRARELGISSSLVFPSILLPFGIGTLFPSLSPRTRFSVSLVDNYRPEYSKTQLRFNLTYTVQPNNRVTYAVSPVDIAFNWIPQDRINKRFFTYLEEQASLRGDPRILNFRNYLTTGFTGYYAYNTIAANNNKKGDYARTGIEFGGAIPSVTGYTLGQFSTLEQQNNVNQVWGLQIFRFYRLSADLRRYFTISKKTIIATRGNFGLVGAWASDNASGSNLPWEKYFFVGGPTSMRGWFSRRLGPGSYYPSSSQAGASTFYDQPGELMAEINGELRQTLLGFFEGAVFMDVGNIWTLRDDPARPGAGFRSDRFLSEIAVSGGLGLRLNFNILIFRLDMGAKFYVPNDEYGPRMQIQNLKLPNPFVSDPLYNYSFGVGYPF